MLGLLLFAALAGAVQVVAPDRWMPASVFVWRRGWRLNRIAGFAALIFSVHVLLGALLYFALSRIFWQVSEDYLGIFSLLFLGSIGTIRAIRFSRFREVLYRDPQSGRVVYSLLSLIGPSEMVIPVLMKAHLEGIAILPVLGAFLLGTTAAGLTALSLARGRWNRPMALPSAVQWAQSRMATVPMAAGAIIGVVLIALR
jgi:hypothetical protein